MSLHRVCCCGSYYQLGDCETGEFVAWYVSVDDAHAAMGGESIIVFTLGEVGPCYFIERDTNPTVSNPDEDSIVTLGEAVYYGDCAECLDAIDEPYECGNCAEEVAVPQQRTIKGYYPEQRCCLKFCNCYDVSIQSCTLASYADMVGVQYIAGVRFPYAEGEGPQSYPSIYFAYNYAWTAGQPQSVKLSIGSYAYYIRIEIDWWGFSGTPCSGLKWIPKLEIVRGDDPEPGNPCAEGPPGGIVLDSYQGRLDPSTQMVNLGGDSFSFDLREGDDYNLPVVGTMGVSFAARAGGDYALVGGECT